MRPWKRKGLRIASLLTAIGIILLLIGFTPLLRGLRQPMQAQLGLKRLPDAVVVLGARVYGNGRLGVQAQERLERAAELCRRFPRTELVLMGGLGADGMVEAIALEKAAQNDFGINPQRIVLETASTSTWEQALWLRKESPGRWEHLAIVTSSYHGRRVEWLLPDCSILAPHWERAFDGSLQDRVQGSRILIREAVSLAYYAMAGRFSTHSSAPALQ